MNKDYFEDDLPKLSDTKPTSNFGAQEYPQTAYNGDLPSKKPENIEDTIKKLESQIAELEKEVPVKNNPINEVNLNQTDLPKSFEPINEMNNNPFLSGYNQLPKEEPFKNESDLVKSVSNLEPINEMNNNPFLSGYNQLPKEEPVINESDLVKLSEPINEINNNPFLVNDNQLPEESEPLPIANDPLPTSSDPLPIANDPLPTPSDSLPSETEEVVVQKNNNLVTFLLVLLIVSLFIFGMYKLLKVENRPPKKNNVDEVKQEVDTVNDSEVYDSKIIKENVDKALIYTEGRNNLYLFIDHNKKLSATIVNRELVVNEQTQGHPIYNVQNMDFKSIFYKDACSAEDKILLALTEQNTLFTVDLSKELTGLYESVNKANTLETVNLILTSVSSVSSIKGFTNIVDYKDECKTVNPYIITETEKPEIKKVTKSVDGLMRVTERYKGHVNSFSPTNPEYFIYPDKTISTDDNLKLSDSNNQNYKFEKVIYGNGLTSVFNANYVFISTDNKLFYTTSTDLTNFKTNNKVVKEVNKVDTSVVIKYNDNTEDTLTITEHDLNLVNIQDLIDNPIN